MPVPAHEEALRLVVEEARSQLPRCATAGVTVVHERQPVLVVGTSLLGRQLEEAQWAAGHGPGLDAVRQLQVFNVASFGATGSWPDFTRVALSRGVRSALAVPVTARGRALGSLTMYSAMADAFEGCEKVGLQYATEAASVLASVQGTWEQHASAKSGILDGSSGDRAVS